jgi:hypothetical protein
MFHLGNPNNHHILGSHTHIVPDVDHWTAKTPKTLKDEMSISQVVSAAGSIYIRSLADAMTIEQSYSDFYAEDVTDAMSVADSFSGPVDRPVSVTDAMSVTQSWTKTGGVTFEDPSAIFDSNTSAAIVIGLALTAVTAGDTGSYRSQGQLWLPDWTAVTGAATLTAGVVYYLDTTDGKMTSTPPTGAGNHITRIGIAVSTTTISLEIARPILLAI